MLYLYTGPSVFDLIILFLFLVHMIESVCFSPYTVVLYVCLSHFLLRRRARVLKTHNFLICFLYLNVHTFWTLKREENSLIIFSVYFCTNLYRKWGSQQSSVCSLIQLYWISSFLIPRQAGFHAAFKFSWHTISWFSYTYDFLLPVQLLL